MSYFLFTIQKNTSADERHTRKKKKKKTNSLGAKKTYFKVEVFFVSSSSISVVFLFFPLSMIILKNPRLLSTKIYRWRKKNAKFIFLNINVLKNLNNLTFINVRTCCLRNCYMLCEISHPIPRVCNITKKVLLPYKQRF